ncbi:uncharacterized protein BP5553_07367 [Venustampulla echinocandica]|uniref:Uncharacterized protein n=1 Tax=Venustampulla echinocandica TaxID=2656787 RepID=A0A370TJB2_9HELO|nr:uncharacterized protein BP5553_07367 [Venustampulla echinocandica]RDL35436.1 hypothetical protein BP5553_07367 [Venustampulla echinocandica]
MQSQQLSSRYYDTKPLPLPNAVHRRTHSAANISRAASRNSPLQQEWVEDYYTDAHAERNTTTLSFEPHASLSATHIVAEEPSNSPRQSRGHQRALSEYLPFRTSSPISRSAEHSLVEEGLGDTLMPTLTGDRELLVKAKVADRSVGGLASWFSGSSAALPLGVPVGEKELPAPPSMSSSRSTSPERPPAKLTKRPALPTLESPGSKPQTSMFNFFAPKTPVKPTNTVRIPADMNSDEYLTLDINSALFPQGQPPDPFSPSAFKNLLMNAEGLLLNLQQAYKLRTLSLHELTAEKSAIEEELEESSTRAQCLRTQLEDMAAKVSAQDATIAELATQLDIERHARAEEKEARDKSTALVKGNALEARARRETEGAEIPEEDLGIATAASPGAGRERKKWRGSADLSAEADSDAESGGAESVFSRSRSPTLTLNSISTTRDTTLEIHQATFARLVPNANTPSQRPRVAPQQKSTFQKIMQGISPTSPEVKDQFGGIGLGSEGCGNCRGKDASVAWDTVGLLRAENKGLKERVGVLDASVDGALALCYGYGGR